jgi:hypothetical protein
LARPDSGPVAMLSAVQPSDMLARLIIISLSIGPSCKPVHAGGQGRPAWRSKNKKSRIRPDEPPVQPIEFCCLPSSHDVQ